MPIFLTKFTDSNGRHFAGPYFQARNFKEAEKIVRTMKVVGILIETIDAETGERTLYPQAEE